MRGRRDAGIGLLFASPWILGFLTFLAYPIVASLYFSFTSYSVLKPPKWIGFANYEELVHDEVFRKGLGNTAIYLVGAVPLMTILAIVLALLLNMKVKGMAYYRTLFFVPTLVPLVAQGTLFMWVFNSDHGILNQAFKVVGLNSPNWMGSEDWSKATLILIAMWGCGQAMVIYLAGLQDVPVHLYEAADLDGAKTWSKTWHITLPMISPVILFNVVMSVIGGIQIFAVPFVMFPGGAPARSTYFITSYLYDMAFQYQRMGYASAMGWIMFLVTLALTFLSLAISKRHVHYGSN